MTQDGFSGNQRYLIVTTAVVCVLGGMGAVRVLQGIAWVAARFWRSFKPFTALDFRPARGDFGARLAGLI